jgi:hypothetical protein
MSYSKPDPDELFWETEIKKVDGNWRIKAQLFDSPFPHKYRHAIAKQTSLFQKIVLYATTEDAAKTFVTLLKTELEQKIDWAKAETKKQNKDFHPIGNPQYFNLYTRKVIHDSLIRALTTPNLDVTRSSQALQMLWEYTNGAGDDQVIARSNNFDLSTQILDGYTLSDLIRLSQANAKGDGKSPGGGRHGGR